LIRKLLQDPTEFFPVPFGKATHGTGKLTASFQANCVPDEAGIVVITGNLGPWEIFLAAGQVEPSRRRDGDPLGIHPQGLGQETSSLKNRSDQRSANHEGLNADDRRIRHKSESAAAAFAGLLRAAGATIRARLPLDALAAVTAKRSRDWNFGEAVRAGFLVGHRFLKMVSECRPLNRDRKPVSVTNFSLNRFAMPTLLTDGNSFSAHPRPSHLIGAGVGGGPTDEIGFHAVENPHYVTDVHATLLHQLGIESHRMEIAGHKRLERDFGYVIKDILA
jgi:hypothetical protein